MDWRTYRALVGARLQGAANALWHSRRARLWHGAGLLLAALAWLFTHWLARRGLELLLALPVGPALALDLLQALLVALLVFLLFSGLLVSLAHLYLSDDLRFLGALPAGDATLYAVKWTEVTAVSAALPALFTMAVATGLGAALGAPPAWYTWSAAVLALLAALPSGLVMALTTAAVSVVPATRMRDGLVFFTLALLFAAFFAVRAMHLETLITPESLDDLPELVSRLSPSGSGYNPAAWAVAALSPLAAGGVAPAWGPLGLLLSATLLSFAGGRLAFTALFRRALSRSLTARARAAGGGSRTARLLRLSTALLPRRLRAGATKDLLTFARDPSQWSQIFLLSSLVVMYLLNLRALPIGEIHIRGVDPALMGDLLAFLGLAPLGLILAAVAVRFAFAAVSLEGRSVWIPLSSPFGAEAMLRAKLLVALGPSFALGLLLALGSSLLFGASGAGTAMALFAVALLVLGLSGLGVGIGALLPRFEATSPARIAASLGGVVFMIAAMLYSLTLLALLTYPALVVIGLAGDAPVAVALALVAAALACALSAAACLVPLALGARALAESELV